MEERRCDFCGRLLGDLPALDDSPALQIDRDGLWVCRDCRAGMLTGPVGEADGGEPPAEIQVLVGKSAGAISSTLNLPHRAPYRSIVEHAHRIAYDENLYLSGWSFVTQWDDGTTIWRSPEGGETAVVTAAGTIDIEARPGWRGR